MKKAGRRCCGSNTPASGGFTVESLVAVDERGQMVLPKEFRVRAGIRPGDKLVLVGWERDGKVCCFSLIKIEEFNGLVKDVLEPMMTGVLGQKRRTSSGRPTTPREGEQ